ncbi:MAG: NnrS family protein [Rhodobacteraceae bacterium]|jgi:uncharacterized protein involved in response to NO|nr:NnrS family protein [Paracoccaceae bacterium]
MTMLRRVLSEGFRIFFLAACLFAILAMVAWEIWLAGSLEGFPPGMAPHLWHAHEMVFGYGGAVLGGFLLTAVPNWTGGKSVPHRFIAVVAALWLIGRLAMWCSASLPPWAVAVADLSFLPVLALKIAMQLLVRPKPQQMIFLLTLTLMWLANLFCHLEWLGLLRDGVEPGLRAGLLTLSAMIMILGGRVTPGFTRNAMVLAGREDGHPRNPARLAALAIAPALLLPLALLAGLPDGVVAALALLAGAAGLLRVALWRGGWTLGRPILWTLHLSYALNALGLIAFGLSRLDLGSEIAALHILGIGGIGGMTLAVFSRATLGHSGRPLQAPLLLALAYALVPLAALSRFAAATWPAVYIGATLLAGALWLIAFALAFAVLLPAWLLPRPPRAPAGRPPS